MMSDETKTPYQYLGERLRMLREDKKESVADVSGAVEISERELLQFEAGNDRPTEDILLLLFSYFNIETLHANELWKLAGYDGRPDGFEEPEVPFNTNSHQATVMVMVDPRVMYSDAVEAVAGSRGVVLNFSQTNGPNNGQPLTVSRIGMSREQAVQLMGVLHQVLFDMDNPSHKRLDGGTSEDSKNKS